MKDHKYIRKEIISKLKDISVEHYPVIKSTNDYILEKEFFCKYNLCYADVQTGGKGQRGGKWVASDIGNIYATLGFKCDFSIKESPILSIKSALGVLEGIKKHIPVDLQQHLKIKLPNDIYYKDQKLVGILIETKNIQKHSFEIVIGVGVNVNMLDLNENIDRKWTSLAMINQTKLNYSNVLIDTVVSLVKAFEYNNDETLEKFSKYDYIINKYIAFNYKGEVLKGLVKNVSKDLILTILGDNSEMLAIDLANISKIRVIE